MAKRVADEQITKDGMPNYSDGEPDAPAIASSDVLSRRKILKPKGRLGSNTTGAGSNAFGAINKPPQSIFSFGGSGNNAASGITPSQPAQSSNPFNFANKPESNTVNTASVDKDNKIKALNENFIQAITKLNVPNTIADFTPIAQKYIDYYKSISKNETFSEIASKEVKEPVQPPPTSSFQFKPSNVSAPSAAATVTPFSFKPSAQSSESKSNGPVFSFNSNSQQQTTTKPAFSFNTPASSITGSTTSAPPTFSTEPVSSSVPNEASKSETKRELINLDSDSESESDKEDFKTKEVKVQGPKFTLTSNPTTKSSPFTFDPKKLAKKNAPDSDDSEDDVEIKGPTFQFNKPIQDSVFKLTSNSADNTSKLDEKKEEEVKSTPLFGATTQDKDQATTSTGLFGFGQNKGGETKAPSLFGGSFGSNGNTTEQKPVSTFSFGNSQNKTDSSANTETKKTATPSFSFCTTNSSSKPLFGSSNNEGNAKPAFTFGSTTDKKDESASATAATTPSFSFGTQPNKTDSAKEAQGDKPATSLFGNSSDNANKPATTGFSFGAKTQEDKSEAPKFVFGSSKANPFTFGASNNQGDSATTSSFNFGSNSSNNAFSFGSKPTGAFNFAQKQEDQKNETSSTVTTSSSSFGSTKPAFAFPFGSAKPEDGPEEKKNEETVPEEETGGKFEPVAKLSNEQVDSKSGEENETAKFTIRSKLMEYDSKNSENPYTNKGIGELKVLFNEQTKKSRILIRADGSLRVLLNTLILSSVKYDSIGNGSLIRVPTIDADDSSKIITYVIKVKTPQDGEQLLKCINELK
ncbi:RanBD1 domain-containing protein [Candida albicans]